MMTKTMLSWQIERGIRASRRARSCEEDTTSAIHSQLDDLRRQLKAAWDEIARLKVFEQRWKAISTPLPDGECGPLKDNADGTPIGENHNE